MEESRRRGQHVARAASSTGYRPVAGSLCYLAPEHLESINTPSTEKSEVYSFAIVLWVILTSKEPYTNAQNQDHMSACVCKGDRPDETLIPPNTPCEFIQLMRECWHTQPGLRPTFRESYQSFQAFYSKELEICIKRDLHELMVTCVGPEDITGKVTSLSLGKSSLQTDSCRDSTPVETTVEDMDSIEGDAFPSHSDGSPKLQQDWGPHKQSSYGGVADPSPQNSALTLPTACPRASTHYLSSKALAATSADPSRQSTVSERPAWAQPSPVPRPIWQPPPHHPPLQRYQSCPGPPRPQHDSPVSNQMNCSSTMRRQDSGVIIQNAKWIQIGDNNQLNIGSQDLSVGGFQPCTPASPILKELLDKYGDCAVKKEHLDLLRENIGSNWKHCARRLGLSDHDLDSISHDFSRDGLREMVHQMLKCWRMREGVVGSTVGRLCRALRDHVKEELLVQLLYMT